jgi:alkanesulfonate monooxygenase SsuD/methylene tetrahydromethanopterin reductase-like flavin-dependent oxidoreductase (luciferase family)
MKMDATRKGSNLIESKHAQRSSSRVTFGIYVENLHTPSANLHQKLVEHREQVVLARDAGFESIVVGQHLLTHPIQMPAMIPHLASLAEVSGNMRLVLGVLLLPLLNPILVADEVATLDWLSNGRAVLGIGLGYRQEEMLAMGVRREDRVGRFNEALAVMRKMWSADAPWSYEGKHFKYRDLPPGLKTLQQPHPPLWVAADVDAAVRRAARIGGAWYINPRVDLETIQRQLGVYHAEFARLGTSPPALFPIRREAVVAPTVERARSLAVRYLREKLRLYRDWGQYQVMGDVKPGEIEFDEDAIPNTYLVGTADSVSELIDEYRQKLGVNHFVLRVQWPGMEQKDVLSSIEQIGERVIGRFVA